MPKPHGLPKRERLTRKADYERVYARRVSARDDSLQVCLCENGLPYARVGLSVGRKWGKAHVRNRLRRLYREAFRLTKGQLPTGLDIICIPQCSEAVLADLLTALPRLVTQAARRVTKL